MKNKILKEDSKFIWHPFTQEKNSNTPIIVKKAKNEKIIDIDGNEYIDLISSWWVNTHGHCRDEIIKEISDQAKSIEQVLFAGFTHEPAVNLAEQLVGLLPDKLSKVFFSDNGSTSVEIAMKVAIQYWYNKGKKKNKFMAFDGGYHGDTLGAMSVGFSSGFYEPFSEIINKNFFFSFPENWFGNNQVELSEEKSIRQVKNIISKEKDNIAAVIIEPLIQGAGGMRVCRKEYLNKLIKIFKDSRIMVIFDEVMTGFGRTGKMFALDHITEKPDIVCLAKSLTGGYIPLAATIFNEEIHREFIDSNFKKTFLHGHTFTANPVGCSAALASLNLFAKDETFKNIKKIEDTHRKCLSTLSKSSIIKKIRVLGSIAAFDLNDDSFKYGSKSVESLKKEFLNRGLLLRPIGKTIYLMPPFCIKKKVLEDCYKIIEEVIN
jgi:adenosylmethionine-8-amino-7-oxononanoate aminotransferase